MGFLPNVRIQTQEYLTLTRPGGQSIIALMGTAQWGEVGVVKTFSSFANLLNYYKADKNGLSLVKGADICYTNGAFVIKAVRIAGASKAKSTFAFAGAGPTADVLTFNGKFEGAYGDNIGVTILTQGTGRIVTITDGQVTERYTNNNATNGYATNQAIVDAINGRSSLVTVEVLAGSETTNLVDAYTQTFLAGGNDGSTVLASDYTTALDTALNLEDFDMLVIPGEDDDSFHTTIVGKLNTRADNEKRYAIYVTGVTTDEDITTQKLRTARGQRLVLCSPSMYFIPSYQRERIVLDGSYLGCALAGIMANEDIEISPTRKTLTISDVIIDTTTNTKYYNNAEMEELLAVGIVPVSKISGALKVARGVTRIADPDSIYFEVNIQRIIDYLKKQTQDKLDGFLGDPNLQRVRDVIAREVDGILETAKRDEVIVNYNPTEVAVGLSPDIVLVNMSIQPTFAINYINVTIAISRME